MNGLDLHINTHYTRPNLVESILTGLRLAGKDPERFGYDDLSPVDHFHARGKQATLELAALARLEPGLRVLDLGGGLGGPARTLAAEFGCEVTVLDMTAEFCRVGELLTQRVGLSDRVGFRNGSALEIPFEDASFDVVWTQHCNMNIADKERYAREIRRVLRTGGRLAVHEIAAGPNQPIYFPVPWAADPALSFLQPVSALRDLFAGSGFVELDFRDTSSTVLEWIRERLQTRPEAPPPLGVHLLLGEKYQSAFENVQRNLEENRIAVFAAVYRRE